MKDVTCETGCNCMLHKCDKSNISFRGNKIKFGKMTVLHSLRIFVAFSGILMCAQMALSMYTKSVLTSIERQFEIASAGAGFIVGSFNIGNMIFVVWVSQFSAKRNRPRIMMVGSMLIVVGGLINSLPHVIGGFDHPSKPTKDSFNQSIALIAENNITECEKSNLYLILAFGEFIQGIGATVLVPLSSSYVDDFASLENSSLYIGIMFLLQNLGPGVGYIVGSLTSKLYVDFDRVDTDKLEINSSSSKWIGAWWLGYIVLSGWVFVSAVPLILFPSKMEKQKSSQTKDLPANDQLLDKNNENLKDNQHLNSAKKSSKPNELKDFFKTIFRLLTDPLYLLIVCGYSGIMFIVGTLTAFMPKFLEVVFYQSKSDASLSFGLSMPAVICIGLLSSGVLAKRYRWTIRHQMTYIVVSAILTVILSVPSYFVTCSPEITVDCNTTDCDVIKGQQCKKYCILFVFIMTVAALAACSIIIPSYAVIMRSVSKDDKCTAIGLKFLIIRAFAFIPSPIVTGAIIDDTCVEWTNSDEACDEKLYCLEYNREAFRTNYLHIILVASIVTLVSSFFAYVTLIRRQKKETDNDV